MTTLPAGIAANANFAQSIRPSMANSVLTKLRRMILAPAGPRLAPVKKSVSSLEDLPSPLTDA